MAKVNELPLKDAISKKTIRSNEYAGEDCLKALLMYQKHKLNVFAGMKQYMARYYLMLDIEKREKENLARSMDKVAHLVALEEKTTFSFNMKKISVVAGARFRTYFVSISLDPEVADFVRYFDSAQVYSSLPSGRGMPNS